MINQQAQAATRTIKEAEEITKGALSAYDEARRAIMADLDKLFSRTLADIPPADRYNYMLQRNRLTGLLKQVDADYSKFSQSAGSQIKEAVDLSVSNMYYRDQYILDWFAPVGGVNLDYTPLPRPLADVIVTGNMDNWSSLPKLTKDKITGTFGPIAGYVPESGTLSDILAANRTAEISKINQAITTGLIRGQGARSIGREISGVIGTVTGDTSTGAKAKALRVARTESIRALNDGAYANSQATRAQGLDNKKIWISTLDLRTRDSHQHLDGQVKELEEEFVGANGSGLRPGSMGSASENINCRCRMGDYIEGVPPEIRRGVNPETGESELFEWKSFDDWKKGNGLRTTPTKKIRPKPVPKPAPAPVPAYTPSKTRKDAERRAIREIPTVLDANFLGMAPEAADKVIDTILKYNDEWGDLGLTEIKTMKQNNGVVAQAVVSANGDMRLQFNRVKMGNSNFEITPESVIARQKRMVDTGWALGRTIEDTTIHELGHFATYRGNTWKELLNNDQILRSRALGSRVASDVSTYGASSGNEAIAEGLLKVTQGGKVGAELKKLIKEYTGIDV